MSQRNLNILDGLKDSIEEFLDEHYEDEILEIDDDELQDSLEIDYQLLEQYSQKQSNNPIDEDLSNSPEQWMYNARQAIIDLYDDTDISNPRILIKNYDRYNPAIRELRDKHLNKLVKIDATVSKATRVLHKADVAAFECRKCGEVTRVKQPLDSDLKYPSVCSGDCDNRTERDFRVNPTLSETINFRKVELQEPPEEVSGGQTPEKETFTVKGDIADNITAGDNVSATGVYKASEQGDTSIFRTYIKGVNIIPEDKEFEEIEITQEEIEQIEELSQDDKIYDRLRDSIAPSLFGLKNEKEAVLYQLFRGVRKNKLDGTTIRGDIHVLFCGDPGTGKSLQSSSFIVKNTGNIQNIKDFVENLIKNPSLDESGDYIQEVEDDVKVMAMDKDGEIEPKQVEAVWKKQATDTKYDIELKDGRNLEMSPTHPLFTTDGDAHIKQIKSKNISKNDFIAVPREIKYSGTSDLYVLENFNQIEKNNAKQLSVPTEWSKKLSRFLGLIIAEGNVSGNSVSVTNEDQELLEVFEEGIRLFDLDCTKRIPNKRSEAWDVSKHSVNLVKLLEKIDSTITKNSRSKRVPKPIFSTPKEIRKAFLKAYIDGEVHVDSDTRREFNVASMSEDLLHDVQRLLDTFGIPSRVKSRKNKSADEGVSYRLRVSGAAFDKYVNEIGFISERKQETAEETMREKGETNTNVDIIPDVGDVLKETRELLGMTQFDFSIKRSTYHGYEYEDKNPSREKLQRMVKDMVGKLRVLRGFEEIEESDLSWSVVDGYRKFASLDQSEVAEEMGYTQGTYKYHMKNNKEVKGHQKAIQAYKSIQEQIEEDLHQAHENLIRLESLAWGDIRWEKVESIEETECDDEWMYDLQVEGSHNYIANGIMSHNSQLLRYASKLSPRGIMTSGKGSSSAGLTAAAVRDSEFGGDDNWTLQAGALVLADQGLACVDEIDKMDASDRSSMHEGLEQQTISVAKAGINATLKSRCTLLAAANPKEGRWNGYDPVPEQIDLEPALVSRFDMIFAPEDTRENDRDTKLAEHILDTNLRGEQLEAGDDPGQKTDDIEPEISLDLFKKYIAYARQHRKPVMTSSAYDEIRDFFVEIRAEGDDIGEQEAIPITARKIEGLIRVSEAAARIQLSDTVKREHAERAKNIIRASLKDVGYNEETGTFDADMTESNQSSSQRDRRHKLKQVIAENEDEGDKGAPKELIIEIMTEEFGFEEDEVEYDLNKLGREGDEIYEPRPKEFAEL